MKFERNEQHRDTDEGTGGGHYLTVGLFNDDDVESCSTIEDVIHHKIGMMMRIWLLASTIDSYMKCSARA